MVKRETRDSAETENRNRTEAYLSALIESTEDLIWSVDLDYRLVLFNRAFAQTTRRNLDAAVSVGDRPTDLLSAEQAAAWTAFYKRALASGPFRTEYPGENGRVFEMSFNPVVVNGILAGVSVFGKDITVRKRAERELRESRDVLQEAQVIGGLGSYVLDIPARRWTSSKLLDELLGIDESTAHDIDSWVSLIHPDDRETTVRYFQEEVLRKKQVFDKEYRIVRRNDGAVRWVHGRGVLEIDAEGMPVRMLGVILDVTERKLATRELVNSEARFRKFFEQNASIMLLIDPDSGRICDANQAAAEFYGYTRAQLVAMSIDRINIAPSEEIAKERQRALRNERVRLSFRHRLAKGKVRDVEVYAAPMEVDGKLLLFSIVHDVSERRRAEARLRDSEERYRATFEQAAVGIVHTSLDGRFLRCNARFAEIVGYPQEEVAGLTFPQVTPAEDLTGSLTVQDALSRQEAGQASWEKRYMRKDGSLTWVRGTTSIQRDRKGRPLHFITVIEDINASKTADRRLEAAIEALKASEVHYRTVFQTSLDGICITQLSNGRYIDANRAFLDLIGFEREEVIGQTSFDLNLWVNPDERAEIASALSAGLSLRDFRTQFFRKNGESIWTQLSMSPIEIEGVACILSVVRDISTARAAEEQLIAAQRALQASETRYRTVFQTSLDAINITRLADGRFIDCNQAFLDTTGYSREEVIGRTTLELEMWANPRDREQLLAILRQTAHCRNLEAQFRKKDGGLFWGQMSASVIDIEGEPCILSLSRDISAAKRAEEEIRTLAFYDTLTGLPNRRLLSERLRQCLTETARTKRRGALLFIDLDNFKTLNDTLGHSAGDLLLKEVAGRLTRSVRESDTVARLGGDEFVVIVEDLSENEEEAAAQAQLVAEKILAAVQGACVLAGREYATTCSMGIALIGGGARKTDEVLQQADIAMYQAKEGGRNTMRFFAPALQAAIDQRASMEKDIRHAIESRQFELYYQPQVETGTLIGAEVLLRWRHPVRGPLAPNEFIPLAEETGLILPLGEWVLETACRQLAEWSRRNGSARIALTVNIGARQLRHPDFVEQVLRVLDRTGANPERLNLELTESMLVDNIEDVIGKMTQLRERGLRFSLDDFGTSYSSLSYLKRLPLDHLKIDRAFVRDMQVDATSRAIAQTIVTLSKAMGLSVIAEGVETEQQRECLARLGCHAFQGHLFSPPLPLQDFELLLSKPV